MITDVDVKKLKKVFATKDDLKRFATKDDLKDGLKDQREFLLDAMDGKLKRQKEEIVEEVSQEVAKAFGPILSDHEQRIDRVEKTLHLSPID